MVRRILRSMYAIGVDKPPEAPAIDMAQHNVAAIEVARQGIVLLKNDSTLPLTSGAQRIAVIGGQAYLGVPSGSGSSLVTPPGGFAATIPLACRGVVFHPGEFRKCPDSQTQHPLERVRGHHDVHRRLRQP